MRNTVKTSLVIGLSLASIAALAASPSATQAQTDAGPVQGAESYGVLAFKGIPYVRPPVGDLRWRAPQPATPWKATRQATQFGADCAQQPFGGDAAPLGVATSEDCLYVNVWRPAAAGKPLPVMVWIYGGGFVNGGSSPPVYDGASFARSGVVLVSFNYRLGRFGFFAHPALSRSVGDAEPLGNYGYMDQLAALQWVQRNARAFGGDPANVTIFGESAGGASVLALMTSGLSQGLFAKAIVQSGGGRGALLPMRELHTDQPGLPSAESVGTAFAQAAGIDGDDAAALARLRALPAEKVVDGLNMGTMFNPTYVTGPIRDGKIVTDVPDAVIARGQQRQVPVMVGATSADLGLTQAKTKAELFATFGKAASRARQVYDPAGKADFAAIAQQVGADRTMAEPARLVARLVSAQGLPAYAYRFSYVAESARHDGRGAAHASELPFVFDTVPARYGQAATSADAQAAKQALAYWVAFATTGKPDVPGQPQWPAYTADNDAILDFTNDGPHAGPDAWKARLDVIEAAAK
ncbi:MAG: carboxylesterase family protein [Duganella sp.]